MWLRSQRSLSLRRWEKGSEGPYRTKVAWMGHANVCEFVPRMLATTGKLELWNIYTCPSLFLVLQDWLLIPFQTVITGPQSADRKDGALNLACWRCPVRTQKVPGYLH